MLKYAQACLAILPHAQASRGLLGFYLSISLAAVSAFLYHWMQARIDFRSQCPVVCSVTTHRHRLHASFIGPRTRATTCLSTPIIEEVEQDSNDLLRSCRFCKGTGRLSQAAGGYHKKNPVNSAKIVGTKWTARDKVLGWRHFTVTEKRKTSTADYALLVATCDGSAMLWVRDWWHGTATSERASSQAGQSSCSLCGSRR